MKGKTLIEVYAEPGDPIRDACTALGGVSATARALGVSRRLVQGWIARGGIPKSIPLFKLADLAGVDPRALVPTK